MSSLSKLLRAREQDSLSVKAAAAATGPRTSAGKAVSSMNALKHGLTSTKIILPGEDPAEFAALQSTLVAEHQPAGELETQLVHELAAALWRLQRVRRYEAKLLENAGAIFAGEDAEAGKGFDRLLRYMTSAERQLDRVQRQLERAQKERHKQNHQDQQLYRPESVRFAPRAKGAAAGVPEFVLPLPTAPRNPQFAESRT